MKCFNHSILLPRTKDWATKLINVREITNTTKIAITISLGRIRALKSKNKGNKRVYHQK